MLSSDWCILCWFFSEINLISVKIIVLIDFLWSSTGFDPTSYPVQSLSLFFSPRLRRLPWHRRWSYAIWLANFLLTRSSKALANDIGFGRLRFQSDDRTQTWIPLEYWEKSEPSSTASSFRSGWEYLGAFMEISHFELGHQWFQLQWPQAWLGQHASCFFALT